jgi:hypothetical protein
LVTVPLTEHFPKFALYRSLCHRRTLESAAGTNIYGRAKLQESRVLQALVQSDEKDERDLEELRRELFAQPGRERGLRWLGTEGVWVKHGRTSVTNCDDVEDESRKTTTRGSYLQ